MLLEIGRWKNTHISYRQRHNLEDRITRLICGSNLQSTSGMKRQKNIILESGFHQRDWAGQMAEAGPASIGEDILSR